MGKIGWFNCPHFHCPFFLQSHQKDQTQNSCQLVPPQGTTRAGSRKLTHILHKDGSKPPSTLSPHHAANIAEKTLEQLDFEVEFPASPQSSPGSDPKIWSTSTITGNHKGRVKKIDTHFAQGWVPASRSMKSSPWCQHYREMHRIFWLWTWVSSIFE